MATAFKIVSSRFLIISNMEVGLIFLLAQKFRNYLECKHACMLNIGHL